jgi:hypothetical protein
MTIRAPVFTSYPAKPFPYFIAQISGRGRTGGDVFFDGPGKAPNYDYPNPRGSVPSILLRTHADPLKLNLISKDQFFTTPGQGPVYDYPNPRGSIPAIDLRTWQQNLLLTTLAMPFTLLDWPVPKGALQGTISLRTWLDPVKLTIIGGDQFFGAAGQGPANLDWPVPKGPAQGSISLRSWLDPSKLPLLGQDQFFGAAGQGPTYDWPDPRGPTSAIDLRTWQQNLLQTTLSAAPQAPFSLSSWPTPLATRYAGVTFLNSFILSLIGQDQFFGVPGQGPMSLDWPLPRGPMPAIDLKTWLLNLQQSTLSALQPPFGLSDWPNPNRPVSSPGGWLDPLKLNLLGQDQFFGSPGQGPANLDWPVPRGFIPAISLRNWTDPIKLNLLGQDQFFSSPGQGPANLDWPNPRGPMAAVDLRTWVDPVKLNLQGQDQFFTSPGKGPTYDWPLPRVSAQPDRTWLWSPIPPAVVVPFNQVDWPLPRASVHPDVFWAKISLPFPPPPQPHPFSQVDWPPPRTLRALPGPLMDWLQQNLAVLTAIVPQIPAIQRIARWARKQNHPLGFE